MTRLQILVHTLTHPILKPLVYYPRLTPTLIYVVFLSLVLSLHNKQSDQFRLVNFKRSVGLILTKTCGMRLLFPSICLHGLPYLPFDSLTLVVPLLPPPSAVLFPQRSV